MADMSVSKQFQDSTLNEFIPTLPKSEWEQKQQDAINAQIAAEAAAAGVPAQNFQNAQSLNYGGAVLSPSNSYGIMGADGTEVAVDPATNAISALPLQRQAALSNPLPATQSQDLASTASTFEPLPGGNPEQAAPLVAPTLRQPAGGGVDAYSQMIGGINASAAADVQASKETQALNQQKVQELEESKKRVDELRSAYKEKMDGHLSEYQNLQKKYADVAKAKIDPNGYWNDGAGNPDTGKRIMSGIAIALSGIGATMQGPGASNQALAIINSAIDRDIDAQKANLANKRQVLGESLQNQKSLMSELRQQYGDETSAELATRALKLQQAIVQAENITAKAAGTKAAAQGQVLVGQLNLQKQQAEQALLQRQGQIELAQYIENAKAQGKPVPASLLAALPKETLAVIEEQSKKAVPNWHGKVAYATNEKLANEFNQFRAKSAPAAAGIDELLQLTKDGKSFDLEKRAKIGTTMAVTLGRLREPILGPGTMTPQEFDRLVEAVGQPNGILNLSSVQKAKLMQISHLIKTDLNAAAINAGLDVTPPASQRFGTFAPNK